ncbi:unnamed protein product [Oppiella nova]|uniref:Uncharacterized protein n=1 Tax=Oppiella nova TaxID=334625 RepID=A0A7R9R008_9ACAR|nr:unnamed protein product [Oppiella nova]CAG2180987.1 unnamed protein product [Oppiella nova]
MEAVILVKRRMRREAMKKSRDTHGPDLPLNHNVEVVVGDLRADYHRDRRRNNRIGRL